MADPADRPGVDLVWPGKYDAAGRRRHPDPAGLQRALVRHSRAEPASGPARQQTLDPAHDPVPADGWRNRLYRGDNLTVLASLVEELRGQVSLVYLDPPFAVGSDFRATVPVGSTAETVAAVAYRDTWRGGPESYLPMLADRLALLRDLLRDDGSVVVHVDRRVQHYVRLLLDDLFGADHFVNEIIWSYSTSGRPRDRFPHKHDNLYWYRKGPRHRFYREQVAVPYSEQYLATHFTSVDEHGRRCRRRHDAGQWRTYYPERGMVPNSVWELPYVNSQARDRTHYPTQKPVELLTRLLQGLTTADDLVADFFAGSGTTLVAAEQLGRRWIGCDTGALAIGTARQRLLALQRERWEAGLAVRPFDLSEPAPATAPVATVEAAARVLARGGSPVVEVTLTDFASPVGAGLEAVEFWACDLGGEEPFRYLRWAARTRRNRRLIGRLQAPWPADLRGGFLPVTVLAADGLGHEARTTLQVRSP